MTSDRIVYGLALAACVVGLAVVALAWSSHRRGTPVASRMRHPSTPPPVTFSQVHDSTGSHWSVRAHAGVPATLAVDIVTFRPSGSSEEWTSEPIVDPIVLEPGESAVLPSVIADPTVTHDVVVAWTVRLADGEVLGSRTLSVMPDSIGDVAVRPIADHGGHFGPVYAVAAALLVVAGLVSVWEFAGSESTDEIELTAVPATTGETAAPEPTEPPTVLPTVTPPTTTTATGTTVTSTITSTTTATQTTTTTQTPAPTPTTNPPVTAPVTTLTPDGREVDVVGRVAACRYGAECLVADFALVGDFDREGEYVCEFEDGTRVAFKYVGDGAADACAAGGADPSITIEVDGVRSPTVSRATATG